MNEKHQWFKELRKDALEDAKEILGSKLYGRERQGKFNFDSKKAYRNQSIMHQLMDSDEINFRINNNLSLNEIYKKNGSKYGKRNENEDLQEMWGGEELE
jgi:hypothetical protein